MSSKNILGVKNQDCVDLILKNKYAFDNYLFEYIQKYRHKECSNRKSPLLKK